MLPITTFHIKLRCAIAVLKAIKGLVILTNLSSLQFYKFKQPKYFAPP